MAKFLIIVIPQNISIQCIIYIVQSGYLNTCTILQLNVNVVFTLIFSGVQYQTIWCWHWISIEIELLWSETLCVTLRSKTALRDSQMGKSTNSEHTTPSVLKQWVDKSNQLWSEHCFIIRIMIRLIAPWCFAEPVYLFMGMVSRWELVYPSSI